MVAVSHHAVAFPIPTGRFELADLNRRGRSATVNLTQSTVEFKLAYLTLPQTFLLAILCSIFGSDAYAVIFRIPRSDQFRRLVHFASP